MIEESISRAEWKLHVLTRCVRPHRTISLPTEPSPTPYSRFGEATVNERPMWQQYVFDQGIRC